MEGGADKAAELNLGEGRDDVEPLRGRKLLFIVHDSMRCKESAWT